MHDASYLCPLLLHGTWPDVHAALAPLLPPGEAAALAEAWAEAASGGGSSGWEQEVWVHHPGAYPRGAICPAQLLLCPGSGDASAEQMDLDSAAAAAATAAAAAAAALTCVQVCLWVHPAAAAEAHGVLRQAVQQQQQQSGIQPGVRLQVLDLRRLEFRGGSADVALMMALAGATAGGDKRQAGEEGQAGGRQVQGQQTQGASQLSPALSDLGHGDALQLLLADPRTRKPVALGSATTSLLPPGGPASAAGQPRQQAWDLTRLLDVPLPLSEAEVSSRRRQVRRGMLHLEATSSSGCGSSDEMAQQELRRRCHCPAALVRHDPPGMGGIPGVRLRAVALRHYGRRSCLLCCAALWFKLASKLSSPGVCSFRPTSQTALPDAPSPCTPLHPTAPQAGRSSCPQAGLSPSGWRQPLPPASPPGSASGAGCTRCSSSPASLGTAPTPRRTQRSCGSRRRRGGRRRLGGQLASKCWQRPRRRRPGSSCCLQPTRPSSSQRRRH